MNVVKTTLGVFVLVLAGWLFVVIFDTPAPVAEARAFTSSRQCQECHAQVYQEWASSEHANSWTGADVRALSNDFSNKDCIDCHAPRPVFETGIGDRVLPRSSRRVEGVDCLTCHQLPGEGMAGTITDRGAACRPVETRELANVDLCVSCHDQHETVRQWRATPYPEQGIDCMTCHMPYRDGDPGKGRDHRCLGGHSIELVRTAVELRGERAEAGWTIEVENVAGGHHFPTDERSRAADVFWRPLDAEDGRWFHLYRFRSPYRDEVGVPDTLLPFGETRTVELEHEGPVEVALYYNLRPVYLDPETAEPIPLGDVVDPEPDARLVHGLELPMRAGLAVLVALGACAPAAPEPVDDNALAALPPPVFEPRVATRIAALEAEVGTSAEPEGREPDEGELEGLVDLLLTGKGRMREVPLTEARALGAPAVPELVAMAADESRNADARNAALHLVFATGTTTGLERVVEVLETASEPWRRRYAAWLLGQSDDDRFLLRMILTLRYEKDPETVVWLAQALARHGNYSGLPGLRAVAEGGGPAGELALSMQADIVRSSGLEVADAVELERLWGSAESHDVLTTEPSAALALSAWRELDELSSERFQLRGVDDARFVLSRTGPWGARLVARALADRDSYVRLHAAQVLERMEARARPVVGALHPLLSDPRTAHAVAEALGAIGAPESLPLLLAALEPRCSHELRVGAAHGLRRFGDPAAGPDLRAVLDDEGTPLDLRLATAAALIACTGDRRALDVLVGGMGDPTGDPLGCEVALERWIEDRAAEGAEGFPELSEAWRALEGPPALLRTEDDTRSRLADRAGLVRDFLDRRP